MKQIGTYTTRGKLTEAESEAGEMAKVLLFDGRFDTGYVVTAFHVWGASTGGAGTGDCVGKLCTSDNCETGPGDFFNANDPREIAWGQNSAGTDQGASGGFGESILDRDNFVVEDLYVYVRSSGANDVNYLIEMEKYETTTWRGALTMASDRQGDSDGI